MRLATSDQFINFQGLAAALKRWLRRGIGFAHSRDVLKDPLLEPREKRAVLASWASDASAVQDPAGLRWLLGTAESVAFSDGSEVLARLDRWEAANGPARV